jgi:3-oxoacyl-[acyl-carrier-protein] synthase II
MARVGAADAVNPVLHAILDRFRALARPDREGREVARPFDARRDGFVAGDGATVLVLERETAARRRGAEIMARVALVGSCFLPGAPRTAWGLEPQPLVRRLSRQLAAGDHEPATIDRIVSSACGNRRGDRLEGLWLRQVWGDAPLPAVLAPKAVTGEHGAGLLAAAVLAAAGYPFGRTAGFGEVDGELGIVPHDGRPLPSPTRVLTTAVAAGGGAAWVLLDAVS